MWVKLNTHWLNMNQVVFVDEEARSISLSSGRTVQVTEAAPVSYTHLTLPTTPYV